jgi:nucleoside-diphosphate-sugar epimerase
VIAVSRYSDKAIRDNLESSGIDTITCDLLDRASLDTLPDVPNVLFIAGQKFQTSSQEERTWALNVYLPGMVAERFDQSRMVVFSTGNVYPFVPIASGGSTESDFPEPIGEYAQSCLGRERLFQYFSIKNKTPVTIIRLNYAVEMRYGVLLDIALKVRQGLPIDLSMGHVNVIWQGDANAYALLAFQCCESPPAILNVTGPEILSVRALANEFATRFQTEPLFIGSESNTALLNDASRCFERFGPPKVSLDTVVEWIAQWVEHDQPILNKPTQYEQREGKF